MVVQKNRTPLDMPAIGPRLKALRLSAKPTLSLRKMAEELGIGHSRYQYFEDPNRYKKASLPLDFTREIADVLSRYGVDPAEAMKLAGLSEAEAEPDVRAIEAARPQVHFISLPIALPSENALADMFESLLALVPADATRAEAARILAQRLPSGFAAIGPVVLDQGLAHATGSEEALLSAATDRPAPGQRSHT